MKAESYFTLNFISRKIFPKYKDS